MTQPKTRYRTYQDRRGNSVRVKQTQNRDGRWIERWSVAQLMQVDLSNEDEDDHQEQRSVAYRTASEPLAGSQPHNGSPKRGRATNNSNNYRKEPHNG